MCALNSLWRAIIALRSFFEENGVQPVDFDCDSGTITETETGVIRISGSGLSLTVDLDTKSVCFTRVASVSDHDQALYSCYLRCLLLRLKARELQRAVVLVHCAQTLDAKMATLSDHSQWIGNKNNLIHSHRMRALTDATMVGSNTFNIDKPQLNVRHVEGKNPIRLVLTRQAAPACRLKEETVFIGNKDQSLLSVLETLYNNGVHSVLVEGGALAISAFLEQQLVDFMHLHIAPFFLGSGKHIVLPEVEKLSQSIRFKESSYLPMGDEIMFIGIPDYSGVQYQQSQIEIAATAVSDDARQPLMSE